MFKSGPKFKVAITYTREALTHVLIVRMTPNSKPEFFG